MERKWFCLVGIIETSTDCVLLAEDALVVDFRKKVFDQVARAVPIDVIATNLKVYASREAFDIGCRPLEEELVVGVLGGSKNKALVVEVSRHEGAQHGVLGRTQRELNAPIEFGTSESEGGVPSTFRTMRKATLKAFASLLDDAPVIFIRGPPLWETALCHLLYNHIVHTKPGTIVARVCTNEIPMSRTFSAHFKSLYNFSLEAFAYLSSDRVVLIDQAQLTFNDVSLWNHIKRVLVGEMPGTPITIPSTGTFGLSRTLSKPGLHVSRAELEEMVRNTKWVSTCDLLWILCSGHFGIARAMLRYLDT